MDAYLVKAMSAVDRSIPTPGTEPDMQVYRRSLRLPDTWVQRVRDWYPEQVTAAQVRADAGGYILCMSFFDITELVDIDPASGVWIYEHVEYGILVSQAPQDVDGFGDDLARRHKPVWLQRFRLRPARIAQGYAGCITTELMIHFMPDVSLF